MCWRGRIVLLLLVMGGVLATIAVAQMKTPLLIWNTTSSLPKGFYKVEPGYTYGCQHRLKTDPLSSKSPF